MKMNFTLAVALLLTIFAFSSCKKKVDSKDMKIEITSTGFTSEDHFNCTIAAVSSTGSKDLKVNGTVRSNESAISLGKNDFVNNVLTIETAGGARIIALTLGGFSDGTPYTISVKPTIRGEVKETTTFTVNSDVTSRSLTYQ